jgi:hypothetical protein
VAKRTDKLIYGGARMAGKGEMGAGVTVARARLSTEVMGQLQAKFAAGDNQALLEAIDFSARAGTPIPLWAVDAWCERYLDWRMFRARMLDGAFGIARKGRRLAQSRQREYLKPLVVLEVLKLHEREGLPIDDGLFARVGEKLEIGASTASDLYYAADNPWREFLLLLLSKSKST